MEFLLFLEAIFTFCDPAMQYAGLNVLPVWTAFAIAGGLYAVVYAFKAIGLLVMAKSRGRPSSPGALSFPLRAPSFSANLRANCVSAA